MKRALGESLKAEEKAVESRFEKAESVLSRKSVAEIKEQDAATERVIRDSFTLPSTDYELISTIRERCLKLGVNATKSEVIRAGLNALHELEDGDLVRLLGGLTKIKTGRRRRTV